MRRKRRTHSPEFKAKVALAAIQGDLTMAELVKKYDVHANQVTDRSSGDKDSHPALPALHRSRRHLYKVKHLAAKPSVHGEQITVCLNTSRQADCFFSICRDGSRPSWGCAIREQATSIMQPNLRPLRAELLHFRQKASPSPGGSCSPGTPFVHDQRDNGDVQYRQQQQ
jgi:transposase-like protein